VIDYRTFPKRPGPHRQSRLAHNAWRLCFWERAACHVWLKVNYLIAVAIATIGWLFLIVWVVRQFI
jgi:hypothetical protein